MMPFEQPNSVHSIWPADMTTTLSDAYISTVTDAVRTLADMDC